MTKSISFQGAKTCYTVVGMGEPVLLLHGFGESSSIWNSLAPELSGYQLIIPDLPGTGTSQSLPLEKVLMPDFVAWILAILENENIEAVHFIGHSMGGYIVMEFASRHPEKLKSMALFHSSAFADDKEKIETRRKSIDFIETHGAFEFLNTSIPALFNNAKEHREAIAHLVEDGGSFSSGSLVQYYEAMIERKDHSGLLLNLDVPVLFIIGEHDKAVPFNLSLKQCYLPAISFVHILRNSAHMGMCEEPDKITLIVNDFLKEVTTG